MHAQSLIVYICALLALAGVSAADVQKRSFSVNRVANPNFTGRNGPRALVRAYRKFLMPLPDGLVDAMEAQDKQQAAARLRRSSPESFRPLRLRQPDRRGLLDDLLGGLDMKGGKQDGNQGGNGGNGGNRDGNGNGNNGNGEQNGNRKGNGNGSNGNRGGNDDNNGNRNGTVGAPSNSTAPGTNQTGSTVADPERNDAEFISPVKIGGQTINLDFDTGSSDLWVFNTQLGPGVDAGHRVFDPNRSQTFQPMQGATFNISYGDGSGAVGNVGTDVVDVGGASFPNQTVQLATRVSASFAQDRDNDGLMGLAFSKINTVKPVRQATFFDNVKDSLAEPVFTADLRKSARGSYAFGSIDESKFKGPMAWIPVNSSQGFWQFSSEKFAVNGGQPQASTPGGQAIADTGTSLMLADPVVVEAYYSQVEGAQNNRQQGGVTFPCNAKLPDLDVDIGGVYMAKVLGTDMVFAEVGNGECFGGLQASPAPKFAIYGDIFFKSQFVAFNGGNASLGMAPHA
ncbi:hypothetical protein J3458_004458 [Metarhizium acridum]|uniref:uncharacterized protein n=1 Tax=Metarhizium acridum TaxID=92637 RepID=UPI001C6AC58C|nr:hypothetical protein J3458_004458 [Metarhizium acridum]